jgi:hypothetical protein
MAKKISKSEIKHTTAAAIGAAFGFIIALIWRDIIVGLFSLAGLVINDIGEAMDAVIAIISGIIITVICVLGIIYISRWGGIED